MLLAFVLAWLLAGRLLRSRRPRPATFKEEILMSQSASTTSQGAAREAETATMTIDPDKIVGSVVDTVQAHPDVHPSRAAGVITEILAGLYQAQPAIFAVSRASARTQAEASLGLGLAQIIVGAFLRRPS
jgi:hypothetical protein